MPTNIAIAGAGGLGRAFIDVLKTKPEYNTIVLSRKENAMLGLPVVPVDYGNVSFLTSILEHHNIHTIICTLAITDDASTQAQLNLIAAANASPCVKRFIPSDFGITFNDSHINQFPLVANKLAASNALKGTNLEWTLVHNGFFLDFYANPAAHRGVKSYINPFPLVLDIPHNIAAMPGDGSVKNVFTHTTDVAKFVVAALSLSSWPRDMFVVGDKLSWMEMVKLVEEIKGTKFTVYHDVPADLKVGKLTPLPSHSALHQHMPKPFADRLMSALEYWSACGEFDFKGEVKGQGKTLNDLFPDIKPFTVREVLEISW